MFTYYAELKLNEKKYGEKKVFRSLVLWTSLAILAFALTYPMHCLDLSKYGSFLLRALSAIAVAMLFYGIIRAQSLIMPENLWSGVKLYVFTTSVAIAIFYIPYLSGKLPLIDCTNNPTGTRFLLTAALLPLAAVDMSYLITIFFKNRRRKQGQKQ